MATLPRATLSKCINLLFAIDLYTVDVVVVVTAVLVVVVGILGLNGAKNLATMRQRGDRLLLGQL